MFVYFKQKLYRGFAALQKHADEFLEMLNIMRYESDLPCFEKFDAKVFRDRFMEHHTHEEVEHHTHTSS